MSNTKGSCKIANSVDSPEVGNGNRSIEGIINEGSNSGGSSLSLDQLNRQVADTHIDFAEDIWEVVAKKSNNRAVPNAKPWGHSGIQTKSWDSWSNSSGSERKPRSNFAPAADYHKPAGRGDPKDLKPSRGREAAYTAPTHSVPPPVHDGWQWANRGGSSCAHLKIQEESTYDPEHAIINEKLDDSSNDDDDDDLLDDSDYALSDDYDSDASEKSHEMLKRNKWFRKLFEEMDGLKVEAITDPERQWHCPACHDGPGAIAWYRGLQPLIAHAKTIGAQRIKLHRELAVLLEEELRRRGIPSVPAGYVFGKWKGLRETTADHEIVWPPMVVIMNTLLEKDDNDKWVGMGNPELVDCFSDYAVLGACHSYGPNGHQGMSVLIFDQSAPGYVEAERLHKQFVDEGRDRDAWEHCKGVSFYPGGKRILYGYLARKEDMDTFNKHSAGKTCLKFDMRSYQEMVVRPMREMSEDKQKLNWYKTMALKQQQQINACEKSLAVVSQKLREAMEENRIVRLRTKIQYEENKEEMDYQERFFKEQMEKKATEDQEKKIEELLQKELAKARLSDIDYGSNAKCRHRKEEVESFISNQVKGVEEFEARREKLIQTHKQKKVELKHKHLEEEVNLEEEFHTALNQLMEITPGTFNVH